MKKKNQLKNNENIKYSMYRGTKIIDNFFLKDIINFIHKITHKIGFRLLSLPIVFEEKEKNNLNNYNNDEFVWRFRDKSNRKIILSPEYTKILCELKDKLNYEDICYISKCFRYERPQFLRYREFIQFGCESFGKLSLNRILYIILSFLSYIKNILKSKIHFIINFNIFRKDIFEKIREKYSEINNKLCALCKDRKNKLRVVECDICKYLFYKYINNTSDKIKIDNIISNIDENFLSCFDYNYDPFLIRGNGYYIDLGVVFEIFIDLKKSDLENFLNKKDYNILISKNLALCGGGQFFYKNVKGVGFSFGLDRILYFLNNFSINNDKKKIFYVIYNSKDFFKMLNFLDKINFFNKYDYILKNYRIIYLTEHSKKIDLKQKRKIIVLDFFNNGINLQTYDNFCFIDNINIESQDYINKSIENFFNILENNQEF